ncbi:uncharacterized protein SPSK_10197 [Sporothrix schenckii 1099-18]|uniref:Uncharacterized protein n=1 Tax=Sporothrix schenckii 1099-18 TaxID=1397361 RepID=A0A0F2M7W8_SPOSC|nr:uncharacterized protein SPSK_10197 [Sporothrix schenckii 1099-18]KJR85169.1 hypothetical protein SPSK_10197 [Sporothrix schenckii 1099-18]
MQHPRRKALPETSPGSATEVPDVTGRVRRQREEDPHCGRQANFKPAQRPDRHVLRLLVLPSTGLAYGLAGHGQDTA